MVRVVISIEGDRLSRPVEVLGVATLTEKTSQRSLLRCRAVRQAEGPPKIMKALRTSGNLSSLSSSWPPAPFYLASMSGSPSLA